MRAVWPATIPTISSASDLLRLNIRLLRLLIFYFYFHLVPDLYSRFELILDGFIFDFYGTMLLSTRRH